jgi:pimeloyl-ACP methyl ester carboxylesterase
VGVLSLVLALAAVFPASCSTSGRDGRSEDRFATVVSDIVGFLDAMGARKANIAGHSVMREFWLRR